MLYRNTLKRKWISMTAAPDIITDMAFDQLDKEDVCAAANQMNHRPRKSLGFKTPWEVCSEPAQKNAKTKPLVAFMT